MLPNLETANQLLLKQWLKLSNLGHFERFHPPSKKRTRVGTALQVEEIQADLENEKQGAHNFGKRLLNRSLGALRLRAETQEITLKTKAEELEALKNTTKQLHYLISSLINFSTSQSQVNPSLN